MLDSVPAWLPGSNYFKKLGAASKHQLADPALAARLLGANAATLLRGTAIGPVVPRDGTLLGAQFESLVVMSVRTYAQANDVHEVCHLRTRDNAHEVDLIVGDGPQMRVVGLEVKLSPAVDDHDVRHLVWLRDRLGDRFADGAVITTGPYAYRRADGIAVTPAALLGP